MTTTESTTPVFVLIDGCAVPLDIYDQARTLAVATHKTQFIGAFYHQPANLMPKVGEEFTWEREFHRDAMRRVHMASGEHMSYITGKTHYELQASDCIMILWITPQAQPNNDFIPTTA